MSSVTARRWLMPLAWTAVALLLLSLVVREGLGQWRELSQWRELAASATAMHSGAEVTQERLQQSAAAQQLVLSDVQPVDAGWQVRGQVKDERRLQAWLLSLQREGVQPLQWGLEQAPSGLSFDLVLAR